MSAVRNSWQFTVAWGDLDANQHMRNTAYLDYAAQSRFLFLASEGFPPEAFRRYRMGPVVLRDTVDYRRELHHLDVFTLTLELAGMSADGARFALANSFVNALGEAAAIVRSDGAWFDLGARRVTAPPEQLLGAMNRMPRSAEFTVLERSPAAIA
ncbi:MAG: thioesterase family protein [Gammaproteobacteria bacterium]